MNLKKLSDNDLLNVYLSGNENAVTVLVNRHRRRVFDYINMMVKDRDLADRYFPETLIKVIRFVNDGRSHRKRKISFSGYCVSRTIR